jgi:hypothetical protein
MHLDSSQSTVNGKTYTRHLLRESFREGGRVKHRTIANLSRCSAEEIEAIRLALRHKGELGAVLAGRASYSLRQGPSVGAVWTLFDLARQLGIAQALGDSRQGRLALWQVIARAIDQGSRLSAVRLAGSHEACGILGLGGFDEDDLYANLDWLAERQAAIEKRLFAPLRAGKETGFFLYDVTSSYLEGTENELAEFGYNRDGKRGKKQIVIGLLCDEQGAPVSIEVFQGNTQDPKTFGPQIGKVAQRFAVRSVTFVGDRGMIKSHQMRELGSFEDAQFHYITAITKPQIEALLKRGTLQMDLFDNELAEIAGHDGARYILRRNPARVLEIRAARQDKLRAVRQRAQERNAYLGAHRRATLKAALREVESYAARLRIADWTRIAADPDGRRIEVAVDEERLAKAAKLDGCYALKTDLTARQADKRAVHGRYKDLALVESAFRTCKTVELELRPIHVRLASRTRGHVFVVMLAYRIAQELARRWRALDVTVQEGIDQLGALCATQLLDNGKPLCNQIPEPRQPLQELLDAARVRMPKTLPCSKANVSTKRKLPSRRKKH